MRTVLDASAAINVVIGTPQSLVFADILRRSEIVIAPDLFHAEVASSLWKYVRAGVVDKEAALVLLDQACGLVEDFEPVKGLVTEALTLAVLRNHPVYDMFYLTAALRHGARLLTADRRLMALAQTFDAAWSGD